MGPTAAAARLESSKAFAKELMLRAGIPTARFAAATSTEEARDALLEFESPGGDQSRRAGRRERRDHREHAWEANRAIDQFITLGSSLVIEEFLAGEEVSFIVLSDGVNVLALEPTQDHKTVERWRPGPEHRRHGRILRWAHSRRVQTGTVMAQVIRPAIAQMRAEGTPFTGFLYAGLMMTAQGPKVVEFNARLGDPETQALMHRMASDFVEPLVRRRAGRAG